MKKFWNTVQGSQNTLKGREQATVYFSNIIFYFFYLSLQNLHQLSFRFFLSFFL